MKFIVKATSKAEALQIAKNRLNLEHQPQVQPILGSTNKDGAYYYLQCLDRVSEKALTWFYETRQPPFPPGTCIYMED